MTEETPVGPGLTRSRIDEKMPRPFPAGGLRRLPCRFELVAGVLAALVACTPTFNWREVPVGQGDLIALLPCKPDRAERDLPLGANSVRIDMAGCEADGVTFAVAHAEASEPAQAAAWLDAWRASTRARLAGRSATETAGSLPRAAAAPAPWRLDVAAGDDVRREPAMRMLWFARQHPRGVSLYQATIVGRSTSPEVMETFFEGLRLPP